MVLSFAVKAASYFPDICTTKVGLQSRQGIRCTAVQQRRARSVPPWLRLDEAIRTRRSGRRQCLQANNEWDMQSASMLERVRSQDYGRKKERKKKKRKRRRNKIKKYVVDVIHTTSTTLSNSIYYKISKGVLCSYIYVAAEGRR